MKTRVQIYDRSCEATAATTLGTTRALRWQDSVFSSPSAASNLIVKVNFHIFFICTRAKNIMHKYDAKKIKAIHLGSFCVVESTIQKVRSFWASSLTNHDSHSIHAGTKIGNQSCPQAAYRAPSTAQSQNQVFQSRWCDEENADSDCNIMVLRKLIATIMFCQNGDAW